MIIFSKICFIIYAGLNWFFTLLSLRKRFNTFEEKLARMKKLEIVEDLKTRQTCRVCNNKHLEPIISLGVLQIVDFVDSEGKNDAAPLDLVICDKKHGGCGLVQLKHTIPADRLYRKFWYKSGVNQTMKDALKDVVDKVQNYISLKPNDIVLDIGANDGTLLRFYDNTVRKVGFEPATNLVKEASVGTTKIINDYFNFESFEKEFPEEKAKIITTIAMFYDLEEPNKFVDNIVKTLDEDGVWVNQMNYLITMLEDKAFDNVVHEHLEYYSMKSLEYLLDKHDLVIFDVELNELNGGSFRTYVKHKNCKKFPVTKRVNELRNNEEKLRVEDYETYQRYAKELEDLKEKTHSFISDQVRKKKKVYVYGASTRGATLLQFYNLNKDLIIAAADRNPEKWGKKIAGTDIPIISEEQARKEMPDYFLILPWYFLDEFIKREEDYLKNGGKFIVPLPEFQIIDHTGIS